MKPGIKTTEFIALVAMTSLIVANYLTFGGPGYVSLDIPEWVLMSLLASWSAYGGGRAWTKTRAEDTVSFQRAIAQQIIKERDKGDKT